MFSFCGAGVPPKFKPRPKVGFLGLSFSAPCLWVRLTLIAQLEKQKLIACELDLASARDSDFRTLRPFLGPPDLTSWYPICFW